MSKPKLKIGLDYHGVISQQPAYFASFCALARCRGHHISIITGGPLPTVRQKLLRQKIESDFIFAISDYYQALGVAKQKEDGRLYIPEDLWNKAKADFCRRSHINFHIDDSLDYLHWFSTPFCLYKAESNSCYLSPGITLNLFNPPQEALDKLEAIFMATSD